MAQPLLHEIDKLLDREVGAAVLYQNEIPMITSTQIAAASNTAGLKANVDAFAGHSEQEGFKPPLKRALDVGNTTGSLSDTNVQAATNAATLAANTYADPAEKGPYTLD